MAGIGFALRKLARQDTLFSGLRAYSHAAVVSCGPWLFVVLSLGGIQLLGRAMLPAQDLQRFSAVVTYNFSFSLVASGPIVLVVTRRLADQIYAKDVADVPSLFLSALALLFGVQAAFGIAFYGFIVDMPPAERVLALICLQVAGGIWVASPFMSALQSFGSISAAFAVGTLLAFTAAVLLAHAFGAAGMLAGFTVGLASIFFGLAARIFAEYPHPARLRFAFILDFRRYWQFAVVGRAVQRGDLGGQMDHVVRAGAGGDRRRDRHQSRLRRGDVPRLSDHRPRDDAVSCHRRDAILRALSAILSGHREQRDGKRNRARSHDHPARARAKACATSPCCRPRCAIWRFSRRRA